MDGLNQATYEHASCGHGQAPDDHGQVLSDKGTLNEDALVPVQVVDPITHIGQTVFQLRGVVLDGLKR
eukprot:6372673-Prorocentrum_lima.AAC.1